MLSVQTAGCAGMERLGVPTRTSLSTSTDEREQYRCRMRVEALQARELLAARSETVIRSSNSNNSSSSSNNSNSSNSSSSSGNNQQQQQQQHHKQQHSHQQQQQQQQQRMTTTPHNVTCSSGSVSNLTATQHGGSNNNSINSLSGSGGSHVARGGIEATTLKYGNTGSGSYKSDFSTGGSTTGSSYGSSITLNSHSNDHHQHYQQQLQQQQTPRCPHHVPLPDSEYGQDRHLQIRTSYQQSEITRSYTKPPPNKTVRDVPADQLSSYRLNSSTLHAAATAGATYSSQHCHGLNAINTQSQQQQQQQPKSKPNAITKFFSRISSPKSPTTTTLAATSTTTAAAASAAAATTAAAASISPTCSSLASSASMSSSASSLSCVSTSSSASSLAAAPLPTALPISNVKSTACNYGAQNTICGGGSSTSNNILAGLAPTTQLLTTLGTAGGTATAVLERIPTPPLSVSVPIALHQQHYYQQQQQQQLLQQQLQQQQQQQFEQTIANSSNSNIGSGLQILKSSSCNLPASCLLGGSSDLSTIEPATSITPTIAMSRNNSNSSMMSFSCNCNNKNCNICATAATTT